jgi:hypothetical protein
MEALGRLINVAPIMGAGAAVSMRDASGLTFICTGNDTFTLTVASTFAGSYATPGAIIDHVYTNTSTSGTALWVKATQTAANTVVISSGTVAFCVNAAALPDGKVYVKCTASGAGLVTAILHDLEYQRTPANLAKMSA